MQASAIIVAAGSGSRLGRVEPKAFVPLGGRPLLSYSISTIGKVKHISELIIAVPAGMEADARREAAAISIPVKITPGGAERQDSVRTALALTSSMSDLIVIHDAARPFATPELFEACLAAAYQSGGAIAAVPVADTLKRVADHGAIVETISRVGLWQAQTPQAFRRAILMEAHERAVRDQIVATDDADLVERIGERVQVVECTSPNLKITTAADLKMAEALLGNAG